MENKINEIISNMQKKKIPIIYNQLNSLLSIINNEKNYLDKLISDELKKKKTFSKSEEIVIDHQLTAILEVINKKNIYIKKEKYENFYVYEYENYYDLYINFYVNDVKKWIIDKKEKKIIKSLAYSFIKNKKKKITLEQIDNWNEIFDQIINFKIKIYKIL